MIRRPADFTWFLASWVAALCIAPHGIAQHSVHMSRSGKLEYIADAQGNRIPDFSHCGYEGGNAEIPTVGAHVLVAPVEGDDGARIQAAIDYVATLPPGAAGFRGAVLLTPGEFQVEGQLRIGASGIILRGSGAGQLGTQILATGVDRRQLIRVEGGGKRELMGDVLHVADHYVPVGANQFTLKSTGDLQVGDRVLVIRTNTAEWVKAIGADAFGVGWRPGTREIRWDRIIIAIDGDKVTIDSPLTTSLDAQYGGGTVQKVSWPDRMVNVGVEDVALSSAYAPDKPNDEEHAWFGVTMQNVENAWIRRVEFRHFAGGAVLLRENTMNITVEDCISTEPVSEIGGYRRNTFFTQGQQTLFLRCWSEEGRHDYSVGHCAPGPNAFVSCYAVRALDDSGPLESWASGVLYDNVRIDGAGLNLINRWISPPATGWSAANCVLWQCRSATMGCFRPPTANNWSIGCWSQFYGDGTFEGRTDFVSPLSLYKSQLEERLGADASKRVDPILLKVRGATNPTYAEAADFVANSSRPAPQMIDAIRDRFQMGDGIEEGKPVPVETVIAETKPNDGSEKAPLKPLAVGNGWLVVDGELLTGSRMTPMWWRGNIRPDEVGMFGPGITRFAPGRDGIGMTDDLEVVAKMMCERQMAGLEHHYGLWYDRRRDTHLMERAADGDVAPPFYEQPFARTGRGHANDGLSLYDLTKYNPWYWNRLGRFADLCDRHGLVLLHQNYFQHNILEAGAHWVDCPWRSANNVNDTGFPEPPPFVGDKRIFQAHLFYDVSNIHRRELHRRYIRQCLDNFADNSNVIQLTSGEFTGPLSFVEFWLDTIAEWEEEHGRQPLVGLSCTKDVQDAILADPLRSKVVDVIDVRYWCYQADGKLYAPEGGKNLAPRQHARQLRPRGTSFRSVLRSVREYRLRFPEKAVIYSANGEIPGNPDGWAVLIGGGSLPDLRLPMELAAAIPSMAPAEGELTDDGPWRLTADNGAALIYTLERDATIEIASTHGTVAFEAHWINPRTGRITSRESVDANQPLRFAARERVLWLAPHE